MHPLTIVYARLTGLVQPVLWGDLVHLVHEAVLCGAEEWGAWLQPTSPPGPVPLGAVSRAQVGDPVGVATLPGPFAPTLSTAAHVLVAELAQQPIFFLWVVEPDAILICGQSGAEGSEG